MCFLFSVDDINMNRVCKPLPLYILRIALQQKVGNIDNEQAQSFLCDPLKSSHSFFSFSSHAFQVDASSIIYYDLSPFIFSLFFVLIKFVVIIIYNAIIFVKAFHLLSLPYFLCHFFLNFFVLFSFLKSLFAILTKNTRHLKKHLYINYMSLFPRFFFFILHIFLYVVLSLFLFVT